MIWWLTTKIWRTRCKGHPQSPVVLGVGTGTLQSGSCVLGVGFLCTVPCLVHFFLDAGCTGANSAHHQRLLLHRYAQLPSAWVCLETHPKVVEDVFLELTVGLESLLRLVMVLNPLTDWNQGAYLPQIADPKQFKRPAPHIKLFQGRPHQYQGGQV